MIKSIYVVRVYPDPSFYKDIKIAGHESSAFSRFPSRMRALAVFKSIRAALGTNKDRKFKKFHWAIDSILRQKDLPQIPPGKPYSPTSAVMASSFFEGGHIEVEKMHVW